MRALVFITVMTFAAAAFAKAPETADPILAPWFESLRNPATSISCCAEYDGHLLKDADVRVSAKDDYQVRIAGVWRDVPKEAVLDRIDNPTGGFVAFYNRADDLNPSLVPTIYCFIRPAMT